jgi:hypothetical protein
MSEQAARRRLTEEAAVAHVAKVRRRLIIGGVLALAAGAAGVAAYILFGGSALDGAAEKARERTARVRLEVSGGPVGSLSGELATAGDGSKASGQGTVTAGGDSEPAEIRILGDRGWVQDGDRWQALSREEAPWAPATLIGLLADAERVRQVGREPAAGRRTTHYTAEVPLSELMDQDVEGTLPLEAWIDDGGLPALIRSESSDTTGELRIELEVLEWDVPVTVEPPPAQQVDDP